MSRTLSLIGAALCLFAAGCSKKEPGATGTSERTSLQIDRLEPSYTSAKKPFNVQPNGQSAMAVVGKDIPAGWTIFWNDQPLKTSGGAAQSWVSAPVPTDLYANAGSAKITVQNPTGTIVSNALEFTIYPDSGPEPQITSLYPPDAVAGNGFNLQPSGDSALGINGSNFLPGAKVLYGKTEIQTSFARTGYVSATVPKVLASRPGDVEISVVNPDGKSSGKTVFKIRRQ